MKLQAIIDNMTLEEKVGQLCVPIVQTQEFTQDIADYVQKYHVGMLRFCPNAEFDGHSEIVGDPNTYLTASGTAEFLNKLQSMAKIGMFVAVDQEGSIRNDVNRNGAFAYSGHMSFGVVDDVELTYQIALATGKEFKAMGINLVQAPIVDVITYGGRKTMKSASFGGEVALVSRHGLAMMKGFQDAGIASMAKHFPGYGSVETDAHKGISEIHKSFEDLDSTDIEPMKVLINHGLNGIMTGHVLTHCLDEEYPATMSKKIITDYLRNQLGYDGLVETDAIRMPAIQKRYGTKVAAVKAIQAGCDLVLLRGNYEHFKEGYEAIYEAVLSGEISMELVDKALYRILREKDKIGLLDNALAEAGEADVIVGCEAHKKLAMELARRSVQVKRAEAIPLNKEDKILVVCVEPQKIWAAQDDIQCIDMLYREAADKFENCEGMVVKLQPTEAEIAKVNAMLPEYDTVIIGTCNALLYESQAKLVQDIVATKKEKAVVVAMDSPYDYEIVPEVQNYICTYGVARASAKVAVERLVKSESSNI